MRTGTNVLMGVQLFMFSGNTKQTNWNAEQNLYGNCGDLIECRFTDIRINLTFIGPCIANVFSEYNQQDATFLKFNYFCKTLYMFQTGFPSIIRSTKLHIQRRVFVRPLLLPSASLDGMEHTIRDGTYHPGQQKVAEHPVQASIRQQ